MAFWVFLKFWGHSFTTLGILCGPGTGATTCRLRRSDIRTATNDLNLSLSLLPWEVAALVLKRDTQLVRLPHNTRVIHNISGPPLPSFVLYTESHETWNHYRGFSRGDHDSAQSSPCIPKSGSAPPPVRASRLLRHASGEPLHRAQRLRIQNPTTWLLVWTLPSTTTTIFFEGCQIILYRAL